MQSIPPRTGSIKKGDKGRNPKGSSAKVRVRKAAKELLKDLSNSTDAKGQHLQPEDIARIITNIMRGSTSAVRDMGNDEKDFGRQYAARLAEYGMMNNDLAIFRSFWEMVVGKPRERTTMELTGKDGGAVEVKTHHQMLEEAMKLRKQVDELGEG